MWFGMRLGIAPERMPPCIICRCSCSTSYRLGALAKAGIPLLVRPQAGILYPKSGQAHKGSSAWEASLPLRGTLKEAQNFGAFFRG